MLQEITDAQARNEARVARSLRAAAVDPDALLTTQAVMALCAISRSTVYAWVKDGRLPAPLKGNGGASGNRWVSAGVKAAMARMAS